MVTGSVCAIYFILGDLKHIMRIYRFFKDQKFPGNSREISGLCRNVSGFCSGSFLDTSRMSKTCQNMFSDDSGFQENYKIVNNQINSKLVNKMTRYEETSPESNALSLFTLFIVFK